MSIDVWHNFCSRKDRTTEAVQVMSSNFSLRSRISKSPPGGIAGSHPRAFTRLQQGGLIRVEGRKVIVLSEEALRNYASD